MVRLYEEDGLAPKEIALQVRRTPTTVTKYLRENGHPGAKRDERPALNLPPDREIRLRIKRELQQAALDMLARRDQPYKAWSFGGKDNTLRFGVVEPSPRDIRDLVSTAVLAADQALKIDAYDTEDGAEQVKSMMGGLMDAFGLAVARFGGATGAELAGEPGIPGPLRVIEGHVEDD